MTGNRCNVKKKSLKKIKYWQRNDGFKAAHSREFVYDFCFVSSKTSQNVAFRIYLHEVNSKFHVNRHYRFQALCFILS